MNNIREIKCDHSIDSPKKHPAYTYVNIGNLIIAMCLTCWNALKGQVYEGEVSRLLKESEEKDG